MMMSSALAYWMNAVKPYRNPFPYPMTPMCRKANKHFVASMGVLLPA